MTKEDKQKFDKDSIEFFVKNIEKMRQGKEVRETILIVSRSIVKRIDFSLLYLENCRLIVLQWNYNNNNCLKKSELAIKLIDVIEEKIELQKHKMFLESLDSVLTYNLISHAN